MQQANAFTHLDCGLANDAVRSQLNIWTIQWWWPRICTPEHETGHRALFRTCVQLIILLLSMHDARLMTQ